MYFRSALIALVLSLFSAPAIGLPSHPPDEHPPVQDATEARSPEDGHAALADGLHDQHEYSPDQVDTDQHAHDEPAPCGDDEHHAAASPAATSSGHTHWGEDGASTPFERAMARLGSLHSVAVHLPIALFAAAALAQLLVLAGRFDGGGATVRFLVWTGALGGLAAGLLGWAHSGPMAASESGVMLIHRIMGTGLALGLFVVAGVMEWHDRVRTSLSSAIFNLCLFGGAAALMFNGFLGGSLAHGGLRHLLGLG